MPHTMTRRKSLLTFIKPVFASGAFGSFFLPLCSFCLYMSRPSRSAGVSRRGCALIDAGEVFVAAKTGHSRPQVREQEFIQVPVSPESSA